MILNILTSIINKKKKININELPSQGLFYKDDFSIFIKRAQPSQIDDYKNNIDLENISSIINLIKKIVQCNTYLSNGYFFEDIKSIDVIYIFLEIVKYTSNKEVIISFNANTNIKFESDNFAYFFEDNSKILEFYSSKDKCFYIDGYKFTLPSIGVENCLTNFLIKKIDINSEIIYGDYYYDFIYFLADNNSLSDDKIESLIQIFNYELEKEESEKVKKMIEMFIPIQKYKLKYENKYFDLTSKVDLVNIWN